MKASLVQCMTAIAVAGSVASPGAALASDTLPAADTLLAPATPLAKTAGPAMLTQAAVAPLLLAQPKALPDAASDSSQWVSDVRRALSEDKPPAECTKPCDATRKGPLIADQLLNQLGSDPLLGLVMAPVTRGVPIAAGDGAPALELAVNPNQFTRGRGLVAIGHF